MFIAQAELPVGLIVERFEHGTPEGDFPTIPTSAPPLSAATMP